VQLRNITQTAVTLEWPPLQLETAKLRSLDIYRNGQRLAAIPAPLQNTSTKLSGLDIDHEYTFQLVLRTTAGTYPSNVITVRTHTMTDTSGISVCFGNVQDAVLLEHAKIALGEMRARWSDKIEIDTTHFVCTTPAATPSGAAASGSASSAPGVEYQRALQLSIPVVQPHWILACHKEGRYAVFLASWLSSSLTQLEQDGGYQRLLPRHDAEVANGRAAVHTSAVDVPGLAAFVAWRRFADGRRAARGGQPGLDAADVAIAE
jgi:hypothetical protein